MRHVERSRSYTQAPVAGLLVVLLGACEAGSSADDDVQGTDTVGESDPWTPPEPDYPPLGEAGPFPLAATGLYRDPATQEIAPDLLAFEPAYPLWTDGMGKSRWLRLPPGSVIDASDPDHFAFPVGATLFKEFRQGQRKIETRVIARLGPDDYWMGAFVWSADETVAHFQVDGAENVHGTGHSVPAQKRCFTCHNGEPGRVLGFSAMQLGRSCTGPLCLGDLTALGVISPAMQGPLPGPPGPPPVAAALGYLHANCGNCHNETGSSWPDTGMELRLRLDELSPENTAIYRTCVGVPMDNFTDDDVDLRIEPGNPQRSGIWARMAERGPNTQMPPFGTRFVDPDGLALVETWIASLMAGP